MAALCQAKSWRGPWWPGCGLLQPGCGRLRLWGLRLWLALRENSADGPSENASYFYRRRTALRYVSWPANRTCLSCLTCHPVTASRGPSCAFREGGRALCLRSASFPGARHSLLRGPRPRPRPLALLRTLPDPAIETCSQYFPRGWIRRAG